MNLVVIDLDQLRSIITDTVTAAVKQMAQPQQQDELLRRVDLARELKVSLKTIAVWMKEGKLPYHRINSRIFFKRSEIIEAMQIPLKYQRRKA